MTYNVKQLNPPIFKHHFLEKIQNFSEDLTNMEIEQEKDIQKFEKENTDYNQYLSR